VDRAQSRDHLTDPFLFCSGLVLPVCSSFRRRPESVSSLFCVRKYRASTRPAGERVTFFACAKKVTKETHPRWRGLRASLPSDFASVLRRFADRTSLCAQRTGAPPARHPSGSSLHTLAAPQGPRLGGILPQKPKQPLASDQRRGERSLLRSAGCTDSWSKGAVRGAEHRRRGGKSPKGRGEGSPRSRSSAGMHCLRDADPPRSTGDFDSQDANQNTVVGASLFGYFLGHCAAGAARTAKLAAERRRAGCPESCQKVTRSPAGRVKALH